MADHDFEVIEHIDATSQSSQETTEKIIDWLAPTDYTADGSEYHKHIQAHVPGTGEWITQSSQYRQWSESNSINTLWIKGVPGSGKSVVAANLIKRFLSTDDRPVLYFFFRHIIKDNSNPTSLVRDFLAQLLQHHAGLLSPLRRLMSDSPDVEMIPMKSLWDTLIAGLNAIPPATVVVDALDEVEIGQEQFIAGYLLKLDQMTSESIKLIVTSRPLLVFENLCENASTAVIRLAGKNVDHDISTYISHRLDAQHQAPINPDDIAAIKDGLCGKEHGLFLQTRLVLDEIVQSQKPVQSILEHPSHSMSEIYQSLLDEHRTRSGVSQDLQIWVLKWVTHANRPLRVLELSELLLSQGVTDNIQAAKALLKVCCGPLLEILENETIQVVHHSFTEFLLDTTRLEEDGPDMFPVIESPTAHSEVASQSLDYILKTFSTNNNSDTLIWSASERRNDHLLRYPFLQYAVQQWPSHWSQSTFHDDTLFTKLDTLLDSGSLIPNAWLHFCTDKVKEALLGSEAIHISSYLGLDNYAKHLIHKGADVNCKGPGNCTPIMYAAMQGHADIVAFLSASGGDLNARDSLGLTALHMAAIHNRPGTIKILAQCGAEMSPRREVIDPVARRTPGYCPIPNNDRRALWWSAYDWEAENDRGGGYTPLRFACEHGCADSIIPLMENMKPSDRDEVRLHWAVSVGHAEILSQLLHYSEVIGNIDAMDEMYDTALVVASRERKSEAVRVLLAAGASIDVPASKSEDAYVAIDQKRRCIRPNRGIRALSAWAESRNRDHDPDPRLDDIEKVATMLIKAGCDVNGHFPDGPTPLLRWKDQVGPRSCDAQITSNFVSVLLVNGADPTIRDEHGDTPLHLMKGGNHEHEAILRLLKAGADINATRTSDGKTPFLTLLSNDRSAFEMSDLQRFIDYGIDFHRTDDEGNTVLHHLMTQGVCNGKVDQWLNVCNPHAVNNLGETFLFSGGGRHSWYTVSRFLPVALEMGVDLETRNRYGRTALLKACCEGGKESIMAFLEAGANTAARDNDGKTCLHLVLENQSADQYQSYLPGQDLKYILEQLVQYGADRHAEDYAGNHLIHSAISKSAGKHERNDATVSFLETVTQFVPRIDARNHAGETVLHLAVKHKHQHRFSSGEQPFDTTRLAFLLQPRLGLDMSVQDNHGVTAVHLAAGSSDEMLAQLLIGGADICMEDFDNRKPLHFAAANLSNTTGIIFDMYEANEWSVDDKDAKGRTPLFEAAASGNYEAVRFLLEAGASPRMADILDRTPLHAAATFHKHGTVLKMEERFYSDLSGPANPPPKFYGMDRKRKDEKISELCLKDSLDLRNSQDVIRALLDAGADRDAVDYVGFTAYDLALSRSNTQAARFLCPPNSDHGYIMYEDEHGVTLTDELAPKWTSLTQPISGFKEALTIDEIVQHGYIDLAICLGDELMLEFLFKTGFDFRKLGTTEQGHTIVHSVVAAGLISMMEILVPFIGDINCFSPPLLHSAVDREESNLGMVQLLLQLGADPNAIYPSEEDLEKRGRSWHHSGKFPFNPARHTALHKFSNGWCWWYTKAITTLIKAGAKPDLLDSDGKTALHISIASKGGFWRDYGLHTLLAAGTDPNKIHAQSGQTPLNMVLQNNCGDEIYKALLAAGANPSLVPIPPIVSAIQGGDLETIRLLLDEGTDPNALYGKEQQSPLQIAADTFDLYDGADDRDSLSSVIKLLLQHGADPYAEVSSWEIGPTKIFHLFCAKNAPITAFIDHGIDLEVRDQSGRTPLHAACTHDGNEPQGGMAWVAMDLLEHGVEIDGLDDEGSTPLMYRAKWDHDNMEVFSALLEGTSDVNLQNKEGKTALYYVLRRTENEIEPVYALEALMDRGADGSIGVDEDGSTNLHMLAKLLGESVPDEGSDDTSSYDSYLTIYKKFIAQGCAHEARTDKGETPAFFYLRNLVRQRPYSDKAATPSLSHIKAFLSLCDVHAVNEERENLLHVIAKLEQRPRTEYRDERVFELVMGLGVDPRKEDRNGGSALDVAAMRGKVGILGLFGREGE